MYYKTKSKAIRASKSENLLVVNRSITEYFLTKNYTTFLDTIVNANTPEYYEFIPKDAPVNPYFDIEIYNDSEYFDNPNVILELCTKQIMNYFDTLDVNIQKIILQSHNAAKKSFHMIFRVRNAHGELVVLKNVARLKAMYESSILKDLKCNGKHIVDPSVYREGLFRTMYSSKSGENRPLVGCDLSDPFNDIETFVCYTGNNFVLAKGLACSPSRASTSTSNSTTTTTRLCHETDTQLTNKDTQIIKEYIETTYKTNVINVFTQTTPHTHTQFIIISLDDLFCPFRGACHKSNHQYIVIDKHSVKQKCHDPEHKDLKHLLGYISQLPPEVLAVVHRVLAIDTATKECQTYIHENFDPDVQDILFDTNALVFQGNANRRLTTLLTGHTVGCLHPRTVHEIDNSGYCLKCLDCRSVFPSQLRIPIDPKYNELTTFLMNVNQLNVTNNISIHIGNTSDDFSCDVQLDESIFNNVEVTKLFNQILDGHKIAKFAEAFALCTDNIVYSNTQWYVFDGTIFEHDSDMMMVKQALMKMSVQLFAIKQHYEHLPHTQQYMQILKNVKSLIVKLNKPGFKDDIIKEARYFFHEKDFFSKLNSKKHLVPFTNGVFDLVTRQFRKTQKEDYFNFSVGYPYIENSDTTDQTLHNQVTMFINKILPQQEVRDYVLKKLSECLNGDIPNTAFLMFIGDGANGKSQLLNLMKATMGQLGEKVEVTLLTRKRNNANEANTEKVKLMHKRFAFLSEPEDGEKLNIGLLKELTGSEEIVARGLYQNSMTFVMEAKLFLACNELPEIRGEDTALWRRIRVVDFPSRFVENPNEPNEYAIDYTIPSRIREDITWRQTFMNVLLEYYYRTDITEPLDVQLNTNEYRSQNNKFFAWLDENVSTSEMDVLRLSDVCMAFLKKRAAPRALTQYKTHVEQWIHQRYPTLQHKYQDSKLLGIQYKGWKGLVLNAN
ncbi:hypothetical protein EBZ38_13480 [bacterium]|nr:hypothetical protein [bacterium]